MEIITQLEKTLKDLETEFEGFGDKIDSKDARDVYDKFKVVTFFFVLKRYINTLKLLKLTEDYFYSHLQIDEDGNLPTIEDLLSVHKALTKSIEILHKQIRQLFPSRRLDSESSKDVVTQDGDVDVKTILVEQISNIRQIMQELAQSMPLYEKGTPDFWKLQNAYLEFGERLKTYLELLHKIEKEEEEDKEQVELTMEEILKSFKEIKELEDKEIKKIEENYKAQKELLEDEV